jgi:hypothetical protein
MAEVVYWERLAEVQQAAHDAGCDALERDHAIMLLNRWHTTERALRYIDQCRRKRVAAQAARTCPYVGEL